MQSPPASVNWGHCRRSSVLQMVETVKAVPSGCPRAFAAFTTED